MELEKNTVSLSIICPPPLSHFPSLTESEYIEMVTSFVNKSKNVTKPGGICCLVLTDEIDKENDSILFVSSKILDALKLSSNEVWNRQEEIVWVKDNKPEDLNLNEIHFDETPFSIISVLEKIGGKTEFRNRLDRISLLSISDAKAEELEDSVWYHHPKSNKYYIPKEILVKLIMLYSERGDLVFDPISFEGDTGIVCKTLERDFMCIVGDENIKENAERRIKSS